MIRKFLVGSEWLFMKIYGGPKILEEVLLNDIYELNKTVLSDYIDNFFYIRYHDDSGNHLRIRYHIKNPKETTGIILFEINNQLKFYLENNLLSKISFETYNREIERYGNECIQNIETLFSFDSSLIILILKELSINEDNLLEEKRWLYCIYLMDFILSQFSFSIEDKFNLFDRYSLYYQKEFNFSKVDIKLLNDRFRLKSEEMETVINSKAIITSFLNDSQIDLFSKTCTKILNKKEDNKLDVDFDSLIMDIIHMTCNRFFRIKQRHHELVLYHFLAKYYKSHIAKINYANR